MKNSVFFILNLLAFYLLAISSNKVLLWIAIGYITIHAIFLINKGIKNILSHRHEEHSNNQNILRVIDGSVILAGILALACCVIIMLLRRIIIF